MPRNGSGVYSLPSGSTVTNGDTSDATDVNTPLSDLETDANDVRPVVAGGTGGATASAARTALGLAIGTDVQAYNAGIAYLAGLSFTDEATFKAGVNLEIGTDVQAYSANLASLAGVTRAAGFDTFVATPTSANLASLVTDETGTGSLVFSVSPAFTGTPTAPTAATTTNTTQLATTAFVQQELAAAGGYARTAGSAQTLTGTVPFVIGSVPSNAVRIVVLFNQMSSNNTSAFMLQLSTSATYATTGYVSSAGYTASTISTSTAGLLLVNASSSARNYTGMATLELGASNEWYYNSMLDDQNQSPIKGAGYVALGGSIDAIRVTNVSGSGSFDNGSVTLVYYTV